MVTKVTDARWAKVFTDAGIRTTAHNASAAHCAG
jgi:hypothetical protein